METVALIGLSSLAKNIHVKTWEASQNKHTRKASQNTDLDMQELLGIDQALQSTQIELINNAS